MGEEEVDQTNPVRVYLDTSVLSDTGAMSFLIGEKQ